MKIFFSFLVLTCLFFSVKSFQEDIEKKQFKEYFKKGYRLRLNNTNDFNHTTRNHTVNKRSLLITPKKLLEDGFQRHSQAVKLGKIDKVYKEGTTEEKLEIIAEETWERIGAPTVEKTFEIAGQAIGARLGGAVGGTIGMTLGFLFPPVQIPLVVGGVFIGSNLGKILGAIGGKIASDYVNDLIVSKIINPLVVTKLYTGITNFFNTSSTSKEITCRSDICSKGKVQKRCKCIACDGNMEYSDTNGLSQCKQCPLGSKPKSGYSTRGNVRCEWCGKGTIGKSDGRCHPCDGEMEYSDIYGATTCKKCKLGSIPKSAYSTRGNVRCEWCGKGTIGKRDGKCYYCDGDMEYSDSYGATTCKVCPLGSIPKSAYSTRGNVRCEWCGKGTIGKRDGNCHYCNGAMEYSDVYGATACKTCPSGKHAKSSYFTRGNVGCQ